MKIALVLDAIYPYNKGGRETRIHELSTRLAKKGHEVHLYTMKWWPGDRNRREEGVSLHGFAPYYPLYTHHVRSITQALVFACFSCKLLVADFDIIDVDHMPHFHLFPLWCICRLRRKKMVVTWHEVWGKEYWRSYLGQRGTLGSLVERLTLSLPAPILAVSHATAAKIQELQPKRDVRVVPNGVDFFAIQKIKPARSHVDIIFVGRLLAHKRVDLLLDAISFLKKDNPAIRCLIIGKGPEKKRLEKQIEQLSVGRQVQLISSMDRKEDVFSSMKSARMLVLPSLREGFGLVALEANACGIPFITVRHPENAACSLVAGEQNGLLCAPNALSIAQAIQTILKKKIDHHAILSFAKQFDWDTVTAQIEAVYAQVYRY